MLSFIRQVSNWNLSMALVEHSTAIQDLNPYFGLIRDSMIGGWAMWEELPIKHRVAMSASARAIAVHDFTVDHAAKLLTDAKVFDISTLKLFVFNSKYSLRFKKLDGALISRNQPTSQAKSFRNQEQIPGVPAVHNLEAGYVIDSLGQNITSLHVVCPNGPSIYWGLELHQEGVSTTIVDMFADSTEDTDPGSKPAIYRIKKSGVVVPFSREDEQGA